MKFAISATLFCFAALAHAAPFVVGDVTAEAVACGVKLDAAARVVIPAASNQCKFDLTATLPVGSHTVTMTACRAADCLPDVFGATESAPSFPLSFVKGAPPAAPSTLRLSP